jgi:hypothetical protein
VRTVEALETAIAQGVADVRAAVIDARVALNIRARCTALMRHLPARS